jgi:hypothetical protein
VGLRALGAAFTGKEFAAGDELAFAWRPAQGAMELVFTPPRSSGEAWPSLTHPTLCRAVCEVYVGRKATLRSGGALRDIAPTVLALMGMPKPAAMSGESLVHFD